MIIMLNYILNMIGNRRININKIEISIMGQCVGRPVKDNKYII